jgi:hypothetical protein
MPGLRIKRTVKPPSEVPVKKEDNLIQKSAHLEIKMGMIVSNGNKYRDETIEEFIEALRSFAKERWPNCNFTSVGSYYIIDGKVCRPEDFDRETMDRKPGTFPPSWSVQGDDKKDALLSERNAEQAKNPNKLAHQPENLLTSKEMDALKKMEPPATKRAVKVRKAVPVAPVEVPKKKVRIKRSAS